VPGLTVLHPAGRRSPDLLAPTGIPREDTREP